jgi:hypothetical protein
MKTGFGIVMFFAATAAASALTLDERTIGSPEGTTVKGTCSGEGSVTLRWRDEPSSLGVTTPCNRVGSTYFFSREIGFHPARIGSRQTITASQVVRGRTHRRSQTITVSDFRVLMAFGDDAGRRVHFLAKCDVGVTHVKISWDPGNGQPSRGGEIPCDANRYAGGTPEYARWPAATKITLSQMRGRFATPPIYIDLFCMRVMSGRTQQSTPLIPNCTQYRMR